MAGDTISIGVTEVEARIVSDSAGTQSVLSCCGLTLAACSSVSIGVGN